MNLRTAKDRQPCQTKNMFNNRYNTPALKISVFLMSLIVLLASSGFSQGTIFGEVTNSDLTTPKNEVIYFIGFLDDTDEEIRIENCVGAGYDNDNWYDDFQNYLTEAPGNPYDFHFFNIANGEMAILSGSIPSDSYHQEDVQLAYGSWPESPTGLSAEILPDSTMKIVWDYLPGLTYRIYRRMSSSSGSFFRIDEPSGSPDNPGVADSIFIDTTVDNISSYNYLIIPLDNDIVGCYSEYISVSSNPGPMLCGDANGSGIVNIFDITYIIAYLYFEGPVPVSIEAADVNGQPGINIFDITYFISFMYMEGPELICP